VTVKVVSSDQRVCQTSNHKKTPPSRVASKLVCCGCKMGKGDHTTIKMERVRIEDFYFAAAAVERAARNKLHRACKPLPNDRQTGTIHVKDASCAVTTFSFEISLPF